MTTVRNVLLAAGAVVTAISCYSPPTEVASRYVKSVALTVSQGGTITVSREESEELAGLTLEIPPGALSSDEEITIQIGELPITPQGANSAGPVVILEPSGLLFKTPARLTLPYSLPQGRDAESLFVQVEEEDGLRFVVPQSALSLGLASNIVSFEINGFTSFQSCSSTASACNTDEDCGHGERCAQSYCQGTADSDGGHWDPDGGGIDGGFYSDGGSYSHDGGGYSHDGGSYDFDGGSYDYDGGSYDYDGGGYEHDGGSYDHDGGSYDHDGGSYDHDGGGYEHDGGGYDYDAGN